MLRKLLKYETYATARIFVPLYALLIVFALINKVFTAINSDKMQIPQGMAKFVFVAIIIAICVMTLVVTIQRFYKNLLSDEGYLMFTLPVKSHTQITSKLLVSMLWSIVSVIVSLFAIFLMLANPQSMAELSKFMGECGGFINKIGFPAYALIIEGIVLFIISLAASIVTIYAAMAIGNLSGKHKVLLSLGAYIGFSTIEQIVSSILLFVMPKDWATYFENVTQSNYMPAINIAQIFMLAMIIFTVVFGVAYYIITNWLLKKKLNLE